MQKIAQLPVNPNIVPEKKDYGQVPGLEEEELADIGELLRLTYRQLRGPTIFLARRRRRSVPFVNSG